MRNEPETPAGFTWDDYVESLVEKEGTLTRVAERLAAVRGFEDDVASIERALRRLRQRGLRPGGKWGQRLLSVFGLPQAVEQRLRWMASYHSRFTDLPVAVCDDLVRLWDHPPTTERRESRAWLTLARASIALRRNDHASARADLERLERDIDTLPIPARIELLLMRAFIASKHAPADVAALLVRIEPLLRGVDDPDDRACFRARWIDQRAYELNKGRGAAPNPRDAEALYRSLPERDAPPFVLCRRANGLAWALWKQGRTEEAANLAREAARHAGDGGHVRLRVMALSVLARIDPRERDARDRAVEISKRLEDETLLLRLAHGERAPSTKISRTRS